MLNLPELIYKCHIYIKFHLPHQNSYHPGYKQKQMLTRRQTVNTLRLRCESAPTLRRSDWSFLKNTANRTDARSGYTTPGFTQRCLSQQSRDKHLHNHCCITIDTAKLSEQGQSVRWVWSQRTTGECSMVSPADTHQAVASAQLPLGAPQPLSATYLCMCIGRGPSALPTLPADAPGGRSALAWEHDALA